MFPSSKGNICHVSLVCGNIACLRTRYIYGHNHHYWETFVRVVSMALCGPLLYRTETITYILRITTSTFSFLHFRLKCCLIGRNHDFLRPYRHLSTGWIQALLVELQYVGLFPNVFGRCAVRFTLLGEGGVYLENTICLPDWKRLRASDILIFLNKHGWSLNLLKQCMRFMLSMLSSHLAFIYTSSTYKLKLWSSTTKTT